MFRPGPIASLLLMLLDARWERDVHENDPSLRRRLARTRIRPTQIRFERQTVADFLAGKPRRRVGRRWPWST